MCRHFDATIPRQCREDGADEVIEKERLNFCDWFAPSESAFDPQRKSDEDQSRESLAALFDDAKDAAAGSDENLSEAEKLFK